MMQTGQFKLYWTDTKGKPWMRIYNCFDDALEASGYIHGEGSTLTYIENWMGEQAAPTGQLREVAALRHEAQQERDKRRTDLTAMRNQPHWNAF